MLRRDVSHSSMNEITSKHFFHQLCRRNLKTQQSPVILDLRLKKTRAGKLKSYQAFGKDSVFKMFSVHTKTQSSVFKFLSFQSGQFLRISVDGRPNRRNIAAFSNSSGVMWTGPKNSSLAL